VQPSRPPRRFNEVATGVMTISKRLAVRAQLLGHLRDRLCAGLRAALRAAECVVEVDYHALHANLAGGRRRAFDGVRGDISACRVRASVRVIQSSPKPLVEFRIARAHRKRRWRPLVRCSLELCRLMARWRHLRASGAADGRARVNPSSQSATCSNREAR
jgi:hypothetical protein